MASGLRCACRSTNPASVSAVLVVVSAGVITVRVLLTWFHPVYAVASQHTTPALRSGESFRLRVVINRSWHIAMGAQRFACGDLPARHPGDRGQVRRSLRDIRARVLRAAGLAEHKIATIVAGERPGDLTHDEGVAYDMAAALNRGAPLPETTYQAVLNLGSRPSPRSSSWSDASRWSASRSTRSMPRCPGVKNTSTSGGGHKKRITCQNMELIIIPPSPAA
jgi:hypothetical protein